MNDLKISYYFENDDMPARAFEVAVQRSTSPRKGKSAWTRLQYHQCEHCPLSRESFTHCPVAVDLETVLESFSELLQHKTVRTTVFLSNGRELRRNGDTPTALSALLGLIMASSPCPVLSRMKGLAMTHTPFATPDEQMFRLIGAYLLGQMVASQNGQPAKMNTQGLKQFLHQIESLNRAFLKRLEAASQHDHAVEGLRLLMLQAMNLREMIDSWSEQMALYALPAQTQVQAQAQAS